MLGKHRRQTMSSRSQSFARAANSASATPDSAPLEECFVLEVTVPWFTSEGTVLLPQFENTYERYSDAREDAEMYEENGYIVAVHVGEETLYRTRMPSWSGPPEEGRSGLGRAIMEAYLNGR
jgi:hypothetical protein